jgi:hypothetical protein
LSIVTQVPLTGEVDGGEPMGKWKRNVRTLCVFCCEPKIALKKSLKHL